VAKYESGHYIVRVFDHYGTKVSDHPARNYTEAMALGPAVTQGGSFIVLRVLHNSLEAQLKAEAMLEEAERLEQSRA